MFMRKEVKATEHNRSDFIICQAAHYHNLGFICDPALDCLHSKKKILVSFWTNIVTREAKPKEIREICIGQREIRNTHDIFGT
jgi:hypothetical protein